MTGTARVADLGARWRGARAPLVIGLAVVAVAVLVAVLRGSQGPGYLDPTAPTEDGSRAVAELLRDGGVRVDAADRATGPGTTVLVPFPARLGPTQLADLRDSGADLVLVAPGAEVLDVLAPGVELTARGEPVDVREPGCDLPVARRAGPVELGGALYRAAVACYPAEGGAALAQVSDRGRTTTVLGSPDVLLNGSLAREGNAALALGLLGAHPSLAWFAPAPEGPPPGGERSLTELVPPGWWWGLAQLAVAAVLLAAWRGRRLGPVVTEPLPVVVRSAETEEGRARLYRRAGDPGHAAQVLRAAARARLAGLLGLPATAEYPVVVAAVAARTGRPVADVLSTLHGPAPEHDAALVALADALDDQQAEVRRS